MDSGQHASFLGQTFLPWSLKRAGFQGHNAVFLRFPQPLRFSNSKE
jgi:hypothetical protein